MPVFRFIGDIHGKIDEYLDVIGDATHSIQVGDFGAGFVPLPDSDTLAHDRHRFIRGNHDNHAKCKESKHWIKDGHFENGMFFVGGALSVDQSQRIEGVDWWRDEELSYGELQNMIDLYDKYRPTIMVTHECPEFFANIMQSVSGRSKLDMPSITRQAFDVMFDIHKPKYWIFGHWHYSFRKEVDGTEFICLAELEHFDIEVL